jgi:hypothetical protein
VNDWSRRELLGTLGLAVAGCAVAGCGPEEHELEPSDAVAGCPSGGRHANISRDPKHNLVIPRADIEAGVTTTYDIQGTSGHPHFVTLEPEHFAAILRGETVTLKSSRDAFHTHDVTILCA